MSARRSPMRQECCEGPMTRAMRRWETRATRGAFMSGLALLLATLGVLAMTATPIAAQSLTRGPVLIETHHTDLAGNIRLSTNEAGDVTQHLDYAPFGEVDGRSCTGDGDPTRSPQFQGKLRDPKTCLDDFGARDYYMVTGRFQSVDPVLPVETALRDPQQWNRYAYARNNPLIYTDPDGRVVWWIAAAAGGAAWGGAAQVAENLVTGRDWHEGVARAAAVGAVTGVVGGALFSGATRVASMAGAGGEAVSELAVASRAAFRAAERVAEFRVPLKHLPDAGGRYAKFASGSDPSALIKEALTSTAAKFLPNSRGESYKVIVDMGRVIGTKGQKSLEVIIGADGKIWTAFPVR